MLHIVPDSKSAQRPKLQALSNLLERGDYTLDQLTIAKEEALQEAKRFNTPEDRIHLDVFYRVTWSDVDFNARSAERNLKFKKEMKRIDDESKARRKEIDKKLKRDLARIQKDSDEWWKR